MNKALVGVFLVAGLSLAGGGALCRSWSVEKDGSGEFLTIHDALSACSEGDTIFIGPGRYDDFHPFDSPAWESEAIVGISKDNLTLIGEGYMETVIGPEEMYLLGAHPEPSGIAAIENIETTIVGLSIENCYNGLYWGKGRVNISDCRFLDYVIGVVFNGQEGGEISNTFFESRGPQPIGVAAIGPCGPLIVVNCFFGGAGPAGQGITTNGADNLQVEGCEFDLETAIVFGGTNGSVINCTTTEQVGLGVWVTDGSVVSLSNNYFHGYYSSLYANSEGVVSGSGNTFVGGADLATIYISSQSSVTLNGNDIVKTGEFSAKIGQYHFDVVRNDLTGNYWGSSDPDSISSWIWDHNDDPVTRAYIDFLPMSGTSTPIEEKSFGGFKAMFR